ncbi:MAG: hypothetical protein J6V44_05815 [Methanobrevibacter sp.]|nr:hypothetical protein [Methanobrevibacter sp.]
MANESTGNPKIYILSRANYDDIPDDPDLEYGNNIFFVRENSSETANLMSLYVGMAHQTDFYEIDYNDMSLSLSSEPDPETGEKEVVYTITNQDPYKVSGKLFYYEQVDTPNQTTPSVRDPIDPHKILFFMWIEDNQATGGGYFVQCAQSGASSGGGGGGGGEVTVDNITILKTAQDVIYGAGADLSGKTFSVEYPAGTTSSVQSQDRATVLNNYPSSSYTVGSSSENLSLGTNSVAFGQGNFINKFTTNSLVGGMNNILDCGSFGVVIGRGNQDNSKDSVILGSSNKSLDSNKQSQYVSIVGSDNILNPLSNIPNASGMNRDTFLGVLGYKNQIGPDSVAWAGSRNVYIVGHDCNILKDSTYTPSGSLYNHARDVYILGCGITGNSTDADSRVICGVTAIGTNLDISGIAARRDEHLPDPTQLPYVYNDKTSILVGYYNDPIINPDSYDFVIANGAQNAEANALILNNHSITLDPSKRSENSNIYATTGASLHPNYYEDTTATTDRDETMTCLPENCSINNFSDGTVKSISISLVSEVSTSVLSYKISTGAPYIGKEVTGSTANYRAVGSDFGKDYCSTIVFRRSTQAITASSLMTNFTAVDGSKIYLMNPDIEITSFDIINIFLFYDGFHLCAIVSGYEE